MTDRADHGAPSPLPAAAPGHPSTMRLQRFLARAGVASRRGSEGLMTAGRVTVNGEVASELGTKVDPDADAVCVDGRPVTLADGSVYLMLNKPAGFLTTMSDPIGRPCVAELVPTGRYPGLFPVGRLDKDTTGLLLFTTDGDLAQMLLHPSHHVWKTYEAVVDGRLRDRDLGPLRAGIELDDGPCLPARCRKMGDGECFDVFGRWPGACETPVEIKIREGRKNQVKRMLGRIGHPVLALNRSRVGDLSLTGVARGRWRHLTKDEVETLRSGIDRIDEGN